MINPKLLTGFSTGIYLLLPLVILLIPRLVLADSQLSGMIKQPPAPDFQLPDLNGKVHKLQDYHGKPLIINFWATWCPPCRAELPSMNRAWKKIHSNITMIAINMGEDEATINRFLIDHPIDFQVLLDKTSSSMQQWPIHGLPTSFVVSPEGIIYYQAVGEREWDSELLLQKVKYLIKSKNH
jgi:peroxiredoxin